ncbi:MAG: phage integrase SAM-like domain and Arm DNA-binding domain-containing protein [Bacteroidota bacterium]
MAITLKIVFRKDKKNGQGLAPVHIRLTKNRKISYLVTDLRLEEKYWDHKNCKVKSSHPNSIEANNHLYGLFSKFQGEALKDKTENSSTSVKTLKNNLVRGKTTNFYQVAEILLNRYKSNKKIGTHDTCLSTVNKVLEFANSDKLTLQDIDTTFLSNFEEYLRGELGNKPNTIHKDLKILRRIFNTAYKQGLIEQSQSPFNRYQLKTEKTIR